MEELSREDTFEMMGYWYERAVDEQKRAGDYRKRAKTQIQLPHMVPLSLTIEEDLSRSDRLEPIKS
jgi:hypothetical protein